MNAKFDINRKVFAVLIIFASMLQVQKVMALGTTNANEFWISTSTNTANLGTLNDPFDGSTQAKFDTAMGNLPPYSTMHILAGTYQTLGNNGWYVKTGQKIMGSGIDVTILQFPLGAPSGQVISSPIDGVTSVTNCEVSDLTCDCNYQSGDGSVLYNGIEINGTQNAVRRVRIIHSASYTSTYNEDWGISLCNFWIPKATGNIIEDCEVSEFAGGTASNNLSAISLLNSTNTVNSGIIRNCRVLGGSIATTHQVFAYSAGSDCLVEGNYAEFVDQGTHGEQNVTNLIYVHNIFKQCGHGICYIGGVYQDVTYAFNDFELTNGIGSSTAFLLTTSTNVNIIGNTVTYTGSGNTNFFLDAYNVTGLNVAYNTIDSSLTNYFYNCYNGNIDNNYDLFGRYLESLNVPTVGGQSVTSFGLSLVGSAGASSMVVTNGSTLPVTFNTNIVVNGGVSTSGTNAASYFSGDGGGLTNVIASALIGDHTIIFAPTNGAGWYRLVYAANSSSADVAITRNNNTNDNEAEDLEFTYLTSGYTTDSNQVGAINVLRGGMGQGGVNAARIGNVGGGSTVYLDVYLSGAFSTNTPFVIKTHGGINPNYETPLQYVGTTNMPEPCKTLSFSSGWEQGFNSFRYIAGTNYTMLNDDGGKILDTALNIVDPAHGGLGVSASGWAAGLLPYTTGTGTFGSTPVSSYGLSFINSANSSSALTSLGLPNTPSAIVTNNATGLTLGGSFTGNGGGLTNLNSTNLTGNIPVAAMTNALASLAPTNLVTYMDASEVRNGWGVNYQTSYGSVPPSGFSSSGEEELPMASTNNYNGFVIRVTPENTGGFTNLTVTWFVRATNTFSQDYPEMDALVHDPIAGYDAKVYGTATNGTTTAAFTVISNMDNQIQETFHFQPGATNISGSIDIGDSSRPWGGIFWLEFVKLQAF